MVLWACAPGVALVADDVVVVDVDVDVAVDVAVDVLLSEPQPTSARLSVRAVVAAVKYFIYASPKNWAGTCAGRGMRLAESACNVAPRPANYGGQTISLLVSHRIIGQADDYGYPAGEHPIQQNPRHTHCRTSHVNRHLFAPVSAEPDFQALVRDRRRDRPEGTARQVWRVLLASRATTTCGATSEVQLNIIAERLLGLPRDP
jgi:hypothetical protein